MVFGGVASDDEIAKIKRGAKKKWEVNLVIYLVIHLVSRDDFDPILPIANPLLVVSPQRYAKKRITSSKVIFDNFTYNADFQLDKSKNKAIFSEKFKFKDSNKTRKQEHVFYMEDEDDILSSISE